jgi:type VI secretion system protein
MPACNKKTAYAQLFRFALLLVCLLMSGCKTNFFTPKIALSDLSVIAAPNANDDSPVAFEIVMVKDEALAAKLLTLTAAQWFDPAATWKIDFPQQLQTWYYELPPGKQIVLNPTEFAGKSSYAVLLFANYRNNSPNRLRLETYSKATVLLAEKDIKLQVGT